MLRRANENEIFYRIFINLTIKKFIIISINIISVLDVVANMHNCCSVPLIEMIQVSERMLHRHSSLLSHFGNSIYSLTRFATEINKQSC